MNYLLTEVSDEEKNNNKYERKRKQNSFIFRVIGVISVLLFIFVTQVNAQQTYTKYCNARYGFCVEYQINFAKEPAPINNDVRAFYMLSQLLCIAQKEILVTDLKEVITKSLPAGKRK